MANVIGSGTARYLVDSDGDAITTTGTALDVNIAGGGTIDLGDVDLYLEGGTALVGGNGAASSGTLRVTIASDTTGVLSVDDNGSTLSIDDGGGTITVDGTVSVNSHAVTNAGTFAVQQTLATTANHETMVDIDNGVEQLPTQACKEAFLQADESNTGYIMIGGTGVGDNQGMKLNPGDTLVLSVSNTNVLYAWGSAADQNLRIMSLV